jgi:hypothetical protein
VAVKVFHIQDDVPTDDFWREISILRTCRHSNIVQFQGACVDGDTTMMVTELLDTDLYRALQVRYRGIRRGSDGTMVVLHQCGTSAATGGTEWYCKGGVCVRPANALAADEPVLTGMQRVASPSYHSSMGISLACVLLSPTGPDPAFPGCRPSV